MKKITFTLALLAAFGFLFTACEKDDPVINNEEELITTVTYTLTPTDGGAAVVLNFKDLDGDGGVNPVISGGTLQANKTYKGSLSLLNETETPKEDVTKEIKEEAKDHQFFFKSDLAGLTVSYDDKDGDNRPIGLKTTLKTGAKGSGSLTVTLRHEPNKSAAGVAGGDMKNAGGETDIEVTFPINVN